MATGWAYILFKIFSLGGKALNAELVYSEIELPLKIFQTGAIMEVFHSAVGLVRAPVFSTFIQVLSRVGVLWGVAHLVPESRETPFFVLMVISWSLVEVPRYLFYACNLLNMVGYPLLWLRYSLFAVLYPTGISGEVGTISAAVLATLGTHVLSVSLPNAFNFAFSYPYALIVVLALYVPFSPFMYNHMVIQRRKNLSKQKAA
eukprot:CAMPEP_0196660254 /NCGR_PEP_ID=MMETSP1086-20130531/38842_1 /TAXON_ID=77921 /ORGANISM="Cyanoptyche  gloeocystis , Strain SAG4.97" /LENGTH=202 /DNA_ID=CAMNT_0041994577 /DNA_START=140 /DNA_END=748 /DNA_ORIENTATION=+